MKKGNSLRTNGIILAVVAAYLIFYFSFNGMWNPATVIVVLLMIALSVGQILLYEKFFNEKKKK